MEHATPLIAMIVAGLVLAFVFGAAAFRLRLSPLIGYLLAGVVVGPFTPGFVADQGLADQLAEIGVILLMFGVGLHFSVRDLMAVRKIAIPGAMVQITVATALGGILASAMGWSLGGAIVFGLALSVASTVVLLRAVQGQRLLDTDRGRIAVGWLIVEDLAMVLALVLIPALAAGDVGIGAALALTIAKVAGFIAFMLVVGRRIIPWALHAVAHTGSRELFRLAVLAIALGVAFGATALFDVSFALGAFFAGMILSESPLSQRAAEETLPLRDAFAVLFFVSVGMLFNPAVVVDNFLALTVTVAIIVLGKSVAAYVIVRLFGKSRTVALTIAASLAQIGEFSFILATLGTSLDLFPAEARDLILGGAIISIILNPLWFGLIKRLVPEAPPAVSAPPPPRGHAIVVGYGRVGRLVSDHLCAERQPMVLIEAQPDVVGLPEDMNDMVRILVGNAADPDILDEADLENARILIVAVPDPFEAGQIVEQARRCNPGLTIVARAHSDGAVEHLQRLGATQTIMGEREIARRMIDQTMVGR
ncbi:MAG TPA: YbaL family putative K(+) efflux transporter [Sphingobium sp.]|nr:YbaL family putative K(+) efflux transporter [Sphingobium sp.]